MADVIRAGGRGLVGAMTMSALREVTTSLGLLREAPPETMVREGTPDAVSALPQGTRQALTELMHWTYGAGGGAAYGLLPERLRKRPVLAGTVYGLGVWSVFEVALAPLLGVRNPQGRVVGRVVLALDHVLYGLVVAGVVPTSPPT